MRWHCFGSNRQRAATAALASATLGWIAWCGAPSTTSWTRYEFTRPEMGLPFHLVLYAPDAVTANAAAEAAFDRVQDLNDVFSDYEYDSELSRLSRTAGSGQQVPVSDDLWAVLERSQTMARRSGGAFDITVGPYVNLWRRARRLKQLPTPEWLDRVRPAVGYQHLRLDRRGHTAELLVPNMRLDLGAIAKGYALDAALRVLQERGIRSALVAGGGDMAAGDPPPGTRGWRIAVPPLDASGAPPTRYLRLSRCGMATSGDLSQRLEIDGKRYSHIVDPHTGIGLTHHTLVRVIARDCTTADALSTTISVLGWERGPDFVRRTPGAAAYLVGQPGDRIETAETGGFARFWDPERDPR